MPTDPISGLVAPRPTPRSEPRIPVRELLLTAAAALCFVPLFIVTISTLHVPPPWRVSIGTAWAVLVTWVLSWIVLPFAVGAWCRRWWWPPLCLGVVLVTAVTWNGGQVSVGPSAAYVRQAQSADQPPPAIRDGRGRSTVVPGSGGAQRITRRQERQRRQAELAAAEAQRISREGPATVWVLPHSLALGGLAAVMAALGIARADTIRRLDAVDPVVLWRWITWGLILASVAITVTWVVLTGGPVPLGEWRMLVLPVAFLAIAVVGPFAAGLWIGQWWWVLACLLIPPAVLWLWGLPYLFGLPDRAVIHPGLVELGILVFGTGISLLAGLSAAVGMRMARSHAALP